MKLSEAFDEYRRVEIQGRGCSLKTDEGIRCAGVAAINFFGDINIKKISLKQVSDFYLDLVSPKVGSKRKKPVSKNTARGYILNFRSVIKFCYRHGVKTVNPSDIIIPKREKKQARFIDIDQYNMLLQELDRPKKGYAKINRVRNTLIAKMLFYTGLRIGELCALNKDSIRDRQFVVVGKSKEPRICFITKEIEGDIEVYLGMRTDDNPALFIANETGNRITQGGVQRIFRRATKEIGLTKVTPHTMRHSFATRLIEDRVDIRFVAALLGHQDLNTTKQYTHLKNAYLKEIYLKSVEKG